MDAVAQWRKRAEQLWQLLDDIDTLDDACREYTGVFRQKALEIAKRRHEVSVSRDGQTLELPPIGGTDALSGQSE